MSLWKQSLTLRLVGSLLAVSLLIIGSLGYLTYHGAHDALSSSTERRLQVTAALAQDALIQWVADQVDAVRLLAAQSRLHDDLSALEVDSQERAAMTRMRDTLDSAQEIEAAWRTLLLLDRTGRVRAATDPSQEGAYHVLERYFIAGQQATYIQPVYPATASGIPTMTVSVPIFDDEGVGLGVLAVHLDLQRMDRLLADQMVSADGCEAYIVDRYGVPVSGQRFGEGDRASAVHSEGIDAALAGGEGHAFYTDHRGRPVLGAFRWLPSLGLAVLVEIPRERAFATARQLGWTILIVGLLFAGLLVFVGVLLARRITRPLAGLTRAATEVAGGDLDAEVPVRGQDEIGVLGLAFNRMTGQLRQLYDQLTRENQERREAEQRATAAKDEAEEAARAKSDFLARMSHEIRTPMNGVLGALQLMDELDMTADQRELMRICQTSADALLTIINDILDFSKIDAGKLIFERIPFDPSALVRELDDILGHQARGKGLALRFDIDERIPPTVLGDPTRLRQVLLNLANNAIKFTECGEVTVRARLHDLRADACSLTCEVEDTGIGMSEAQLSQVFHAFSQADSSTTRRFGGTGLGLAIVESLVGAMGGNIQVESTQGRGTRFWFSLVYALPSPASSGVAEPAASVVEAARERADEEGDPRILVVEDNDINRKVATRMLAGLGYRCDIAHDGREAVEMTSRQEYDVVLMDCEMPRMDGYHATRAIRAQENADGARTTIIAMTASAYEEDRERCLVAGMDDYMSKPLARGELQSMLQRHLLHERGADRDALAVSAEVTAGSA